MSTSESAQPQKDIKSILLSVIAFVIVIAALKWSQPVTLPLTFALFIVALAWPLQSKLSEHMPYRLAFGLTLLSVVVLFAIFCGLLFLCGAMIAQRAPEYSDSARQVYSRTQELASGVGVSMPPAEELGSSVSGGGNGLRILRSGGGRLLSVTGAFVLTFAFLGLALLDARRIHAKLREKSDDRSRQVLDALHEMTCKFQRYFLVRTAISALQGVCTFLFSLLIGLDFAFVWGLSSMLLNYIPTLGSIVAVIPPTLFALFQFESPWMALLVFGGNCLIQILLGVFVDPLLEGKQLQLSPLVVLFSIAFWGWVWGIGGALIGVPVTVGIVIICQHLDRLRWISDLLTTGELDKKEVEEKSA